MRWISVSVPGLPGCCSEGDTEAEGIANIHDAIEDCLAAVVEVSRDQESYTVDVTA